MPKLHSVDKIQLSSHLIEFVYDIYVTYFFQIHILFAPTKMPELRVKTIMRCCNTGM